MATARTAVVEPGVVLTDLLAAASPLGLAFGADPSSASRATLGGMIANNACGAHSVAWGTTADNVRSLDVLLADGTRCTVDAVGNRAAACPQAWPGGRAAPAAAGFRRPARVGDPAAVRAVHPADLRVRVAPAAAGERLRRRGVAVRQRGRFRDDAAGDGRADPVACGKGVVCARVRRLDHVGGVRAGGAAARSADDGVDQHRPGRAAPGRGPRRRRSRRDFRRDERGCWWRWAAQDQASAAGGRREDARGAARLRLARDRLAGHRSRGAGECCGGAGRTRPDWRPVGPTAPRPGVVGRTPLFRRRGWATTCAGSTNCWAGTDSPGRPTGTSVRAACTCGSISTCSAGPASRPTANSSSRQRIWWSRWAARFPVSTATGGRARSCSAGCTARTGCGCSPR